MTDEEKSELRRRAEAFLRINGVFQVVSPGMRTGATFVAAMYGLQPVEVHIVGCLREEALLWLDIHVDLYTVLSVNNDRTETWQDVGLAAYALDVLQRSMVLDDLANGPMNPH